jgi:sulfur-oxidizing protein SoxA
MTGGAALAVVTLALAAAAGTPCTARAAESGADARRSGFEYMRPATQAMQRDDAQNPAMLWVADGEALWQRKAGRADRSCADCHGAAAKGMRGVAARYPAYDAEAQRPIDLGQRISLCRQRRQQAAPFAAESTDLLALASFVARQSRGLPIEPPADPRLAPFLERGRQLYFQRIGQLDLACAQCHDDNAGRRLGGSVIPQGHPTGYPIYRLEWQGVGSLQRRLRNCMTGVRAELPPYDAPVLVELELYLAARAAGMTVDAPAVRP